MQKVKLFTIAELNPKKLRNDLPLDYQVSFVRMKAVAEESGAIDLSDVRSISKVKKGYTSFQNGDILFAKITPCMENGKIAIARDLKNGIGFGSTEFHVVRPKEVVDTTYLFRFLVSLQTRKFAQDKMTGTAGQLRVPVSFLRDLDIPLPPIPEQKRIVAKIEELFSDLDAAVESLKKAQAQLKTYRQAVLKYAFEGRLTHKNIKPGQLPDGWKWVKLGDVAETCLGKMLDKQKNKGEFEPYLRNISVRWFEFNLTDLEKMRFTKDENVRYSVEYNDLVVCEGGEPGRAAIWKDKSSSIKIQKALHRVRFGSGAIPDYFLYFLYLTAHNGVLKKYFTGTTIKHLTGKRLNEVVFPLTTVAEQKSIVAEIETRLSEADYMEKTIIQSIEKAEATRQSILKKAFEGRLV